MADRPRLEVIGANPNLPLIALPLEEAAAALGYSLKHFNRHVRPDLRLTRCAGRPTVPVRELERWADDHAEHVLRGAA